MFGQGEAGGQQGLDLRVREFAREPIGAKQKQVTGLGFKLEDIGSDAALCAECSCNHISERRAESFGRRHAAHADLLIDQRMILGDLLQMSGPHAIAATISDVENPNAALLHHQGHQSSAHAA